MVFRPVRRVGGRGGHQFRRRSEVNGAYLNSVRTARNSRAPFGNTDSATHVTARGGVIFGLRHRGSSFRRFPLESNTSVVRIRWSPTCSRTQSKTSSSLPSATASGDRQSFSRIVFFSRDSANTTRSRRPLLEAFVALTYWRTITRLRPSLSQRASEQRSGSFQFTLPAGISAM